VVSQGPRRNHPSSRRGAEPRTPHEGPDVYEGGEESIELGGLPRRIKEARREMGWKQEELAAKMTKGSV
jgi:ribosome-binding protein aMBF1 (putative translation factor)